MASTPPTLGLPCPPPRAFLTPGLCAGGRLWGLGRLCHGGALGHEPGRPSWGRCRALGPLLVARLGPGCAGDAVLGGPTSPPFSSPLPVRGSAPPSPAASPLRAPVVVPAAAPGAQGPEPAWPPGGTRGFAHRTAHRLLGPAAGCPGALGRAGAPPPQAWDPWGFLGPLGPGPCARRVLCTPGRGEWGGRAMLSGVFMPAGRWMPPTWSPGPSVGQIRGMVSGLGSRRGQRALTCSNPGRGRGTGGRWDQRLCDPRALPCAQEVSPVTGPGPPAWQCCALPWLATASTPHTPSLWWLSRVLAAAGP